MGKRGGLSALPKDNPLILYWNIQKSLTILLNSSLAKIEKCPCVAVHEGVPLSMLPEL